MASEDLLARDPTGIAASAVAEDDRFYMVDVSAADALKDRGIEVSNAREVLMPYRIFTGDIGSGEKGTDEAGGTDIVFSPAFSSAPTHVIAVTGYQETDEAGVDVYVDPGSITTSGCVVKAKSGSHTGINVTVIIAR
jgi:hypothetical protein